MCRTELQNSVKRRKSILSVLGMPKSTEKNGLYPRIIFAPVALLIIGLIYVIYGNLFLFSQDTLFDTYLKDDSSGMMVSLTLDFKQQR